eukprot:7631479-Prorocentrum_lima.AAC.1
MRPEEERVPGEAELWHPGRDLDEINADEAVEAEVVDIAEEIQDEVEDIELEAPISGGESVKAST